MGGCESEQMLSTTHVPVLGRLGSVGELRVINSVWLRDYQGLYDYESKQIRKHLYTVKANSIFYSNNGEKMIKETTKTSRAQEMFKNAGFEMVKRSNYYKIQPVSIQNENETVQRLLWLIVRTVPGQKYPLKEKDILKLGKQRIKVREIVHNDHHSELTDFNAICTTKTIYQDLRLKQNQPVSVPLPSKEDMAVHEMHSIATQNEIICRICLQPGELTNPLICPCKCLGSVRYIHLRCLRMWLGKRLNVVKSKNFITIKWTPLTCEMCKSHYKYRIYLDNKKYYTVEIPKPGKPYVVLQVMKRNAEASKIFHFVTLSETSKVSLGRKKEIDIKISEDISVSRHHANLIYDFENRQFLLEDNKSKFGTLVLIKRNLLVNPFQRGISFQLGGEVFTFDTTRGEGAIADYYDEEQYLNVMERGDTVEQSESEENNEEYSDEAREEENIAPAAVGSNNNIEAPPNANTSVLNVHANNSLERENNDELGNIELGGREGQVGMDV